MSSPARLDLSKPRYDQSTFEGRAKHFFVTTNPLNVLISDADLDRAAKIVRDYEKGEEDKSLTEDEIWKAKEQYDSAFHCQTGEKLFLPGRMSFQVPGNMCITGCMMTFYKSAPAVIFWQSANQGFNAVVNTQTETLPVSNEQLGTAALGATSAVLSLHCRSTSSSQAIPLFKPVLSAGYASSRCCRGKLCEYPNDEATRDYPRHQHILEDGTEVGKSGNAAKAAIGQVIPVASAWPFRVCLFPQS